MYWTRGKNELESDNLGFIDRFFGRHAGYVRRISPMFLFCLFLFTFSLVMGFYMGEGLEQDALNELTESYSDLGNLGALGLFVFIVVNNIGKSLVFMILGLVLSIPPLLFVVFNGFFIGWLSYAVSVETGLGFVALALIPHGIVEIPAILLSMCMGMGLGYQAVNRLRGRHGLGAEWRDAWGLFLWRIAPILIFGAVLEISLTPWLLEAVGYL